MTGPPDCGGKQSRRLRGEAHRAPKKITGRMGEVSGQSVKGENGI
jgi:hypothetical protein